MPNYLKISGDLNKPLILFCGTEIRKLPCQAVKFSDTFWETKILLNVLRIEIGIVILPSNNGCHADSTLISSSARNKIHAGSSRRSPPWPAFRSSKFPPQWATKAGHISIKIQTQATIRPSLQKSRVPFLARG